MRWTFKQLSYEQRQSIHKMISHGYTNAEIAKRIGVHLSTIYRELERGSVNGEYDPDCAEELYQQQLSEKGAMSIVCNNSKLSEYIALLILEEHMSAASIVDVWEREKQFDTYPKSVQTIYTAIDNGFIPGVTRDSLHSDTTTIYNDQIHFVKWVREWMNISNGDVMHFEVVGDKLIFTKATIEGEETKVSSEP